MFSVKCNENIGLITKTQHNYIFNVTVLISNLLSNHLPFEEAPGIYETHLPGAF